jgi:hypothetical protein
MWQGEDEKAANKPATLVLSPIGPGAVGALVELRKEGGRRWTAKEKI